jgi:hypothetical protein
MEIQKVVCSQPAFLSSAARFETTALARSTLRNIQTLTLAGCAWGSPYNLIEAVISMPALRYLDISWSDVELRDVLFSCYHFLAHLHTLVFRQDARPAVAVPAGQKRMHRWHDPREDMFKQREKMVEAKLLKDMRADDARIREMGEQADGELKRRQWVVKHITGDDKRHSMSLTSLDISGHTLTSGTSAIA